MAIAGVRDYAGSYVNAADNRKQAEGNNSTDRVNGTNTEGSASVKRTTKEYLKNLEQKYGVNITEGKNTTAKSFKGYMLSSAGGNNVYIESNIADKMAADPDYAAKYEKLIANTPEDGKRTEKEVEELCNGTAKLVASGMQIHANGKVTYWGVAVHVGPQVRLGTEYRKMANEKLAKLREAKKKSAQQAEQLEEKRTAQSEAQEKLVVKRVEQAESREKLVEKMTAGSGEEIITGGRLDVSV